MEAIKCIMTRRSVRKYSAKKVSGAQIKKILDCALNAPSANNQQAWQFMLIKDRQTLLGITGVHPSAQKLKQAQCAIIVCGDLAAENSKDYWVQDCSAATQNILLAANALGLGAVWLGVYPRMQRVADVQKLLGIPEGVVPLSIVSIGCPAEKPKPVKRFNAKKLHIEKW